MDPERRSSASNGSDKPSPTSSLASASAYAGLGLQFALSILLFVWTGQWLDRKLGTDPWLLILGAFVGAGAGFYAIYRRLTSDLQREEARRKSGEGGDRR
ncbi:MAG TPA: AtpZ/AtpI family protein [Gemmatimonadaceae bacterium]|nr:AtpZ/AtpI family protein [Gemmatimonadaceae bacterium]